MKSFLLTIAGVMAFAGITFGQNLPPDYYWEVGFNMGYSNFVRPSGPAESYKGTRTRPSTDKSLRLNYYASPNWMISLDLGARRWETSGDWVVNSQLGQKLKPKKVTFLLAEQAINESVGINYVIPFYSGYNTFNKANLTFGVNFGLMQTMNDGSMGYSRYKEGPDSNLTYLSSYNYESGLGYNVGINIGYTYYIIPRLGINIDLAARYARINTGDSRYGSVNSRYELLYFPQTLGLRWRF